MTHQSPLITIIVPIYNTEKYLDQCMESALCQTYSNIEIILVDDGSREQCAKLCDAYAEKYERVSVIHKKNAGLGMARNTGMEHTSGEYVTFLDSDDYIAEDLIENLYNAVQYTGTDTSKAGFLRFDNDGTIVSTKKYSDEVFPGDCARSKYAIRMIGSRPDAKDSLEMSVCATLYRMSIIRKHKLCFVSEREMISEDLCFNIDYAQYADGACTISNCGYYYRENMSSLSRQYKPERMAQCCDFYQKMKQRLAELGYGKDTIYRLDRMLFINTRVCIRQVVQGRKAFMLEDVREIRSICTQQTLQDVISEHPIEKMKFGQRFFIILLKNRCSMLLYTIGKMGIC